MIRSIRIAVGAILVTAVLAGCAATPSPAGGGSGGAIDPVWRASIVTLGWPSEVDGVVVSFLAVGGGAEALGAWDAETGTELWAAATVPGGGDPDSFHRPAVRSDGGDPVVAYLRADPASPGGFELVAADARTGEVVDAAPVAATSGRPGFCDGEACVRDGERVLVLRDGALVPLEDGAEVAFVPPGSSSVGSYVSLGESGEVQFGQDGRVVWQRPYTDVFGGDAVPGWGTAWWDDGDSEAIVGWARILPAATDLAEPGSLTTDLADAQRLAGLERSTGDALWSTEGARPCRIGNWAPVDRDLVAVCRVEAGTMSMTWTGTERSVPIEEEGVAQTLVALDRATGEERWSVPVDDLPEGVELLEQGDDVVVLSGGRVQTVDPDAGEVTARPAGSAVLCFVSAKVPLYDADRRTTTYTNWRRSLCDEHGATVEGAMTHDILRVAGYESGFVVLNRTDGMEVYDLGAPRDRSEHGS